MPLYRPTELHQFLTAHGIEPKKGLSQNFLIDGNIIRKIVDTAQIEAGDVVLEIGPGPGSLTEELLAREAIVYAIEKDHRLAEALKRLQTADNRLQIVVGDALKIDFHSLLQPILSKANRKAKIVANLPYNITTPLITTFLPQWILFSRIVVMVQDEVAERICAEAKSSAIGSLTLFCRFYSTPTYSFKIKRSCFYPSPSVDSAVVQFVLHKSVLEGDEELFFFSLTRKAYQQRRKMMRASLKEIAPPDKIEEALAKVGLSPAARPEELSFEQFIAFAKSLKLSLSKEKEKNCSSD